MSAHKKFIAGLSEPVQVREWLALRRLELVELEHKIILGEQWLATHKVKSERCNQRVQNKINKTYGII